MTDSKYIQEFRVVAWGLYESWTILARFNSYLNAKAFVDTLDVEYPVVKIEKLWVPR